jgi:hypothetical protein
VRVAQIVGPEGVVDVLDVQPAILSATRRRCGGSGRHSLEDAVEQVFAEPALSEGNGLAILHVEVDDVVLIETPDLFVVVQLAGEFIAI